MGTKSNFGCDWMMLYGGQKCVYVCVFVCVLIVSRLCEQKTNQNKTQKKQSNKQKPQQNCVFNNKLEFHFPPASFHSSTTSFHHLPPHAASYPPLSSHFSYRFASLPVENLTLQHLSPPAEKYWSMMAYNNVKLCNVLFAQELAQVSHDPVLDEISLPLSVYYILHSSLALETSWHIGLLAASWQHGLLAAVT